MLHPMSSTPALVAKRYQLTRLLGNGGMGRVWLAQDVKLDRRVAVKEIIPPKGLSPREREEVRLRTLREARTAASLSHPNVVRVFDTMNIDDQPWIVMEYVPSRSLQEVIDQDGPLSPERVCEIGLSVLAALRAAHATGVLHRDVKPGNVLLAEDGRVVLTDFGLATFDGDAQVTRTGLILGSPQYISPERASKGVSLPESDLWSFGATMYAAVEGRAPYARANALATLTALVTEDPDPAPHSGPLQPVLDALLRKDPTQRPTALAVERQLRRILADSRAKSGAPPLQVQRRIALRKPRRAKAEAATPKPVKGQPAKPPATPPGIPPATPAPAPATMVVPPSAVPAAAATMLVPHTAAPTQPPAQPPTVVGLDAATTAMPHLDAATSVVPAAAAATSILRSGPATPVRPKTPIFEPQTALIEPRTTSVDLPHPPATPGNSTPGPGVTVRGATTAAGIAAGIAARAATGAAMAATTSAVIAVRGAWRQHRFLRFVIIAVALAVAVAILATTVDSSGDSSGEPSKKPGSAGSAGPSTQARTSAAPSVAAAAAGPGTSGSTTTGTPTQTASGFALPPGWETHQDPTGFQVAVPQGWTESRRSTQVYFREPNGVRYLLIDQTSQPLSDPVADWTNQEQQRSWTYPGYSRVGITAVNYFRTCADWEFTYNYEDGTRVHVIDRGFVTGPTHGYAIYWLAPEADWQSSLGYFANFAASFRPAD